MEELKKESAPVMVATEDCSDVEEVDTGEAVEGVSSLDAEALAARRREKKKQKKKTLILV